MTRPLRVEFPGAVYHITSRGNAKQPIYLTDQDRIRFLNILNFTCRTHNWICHAYCLMDNHYHLLIETIDGNLSQGMRDLNGIYTQRFNYIYDRVGHLFQGRYKAFVIEKDSYLLQVARYTVLNAVRAGLAVHPRNWRWCSYNATVGIAKPIACLKPDLILGVFSNDLTRARKQYRLFVTSGMDDPSPFNEIKEGIILGSPQFVNFIWGKTCGVESVKEVSRSERVVGRPMLEELFEDIGNMDKEQRNKTIVFARYRCGYLITEIARHLSLDSSTVGKIIKNVR